MKIKKEVVRVKSARKMGSEYLYMLGILMAVVGLFIFAVGLYIFYNVQSLKVLGAGLIFVSLVLLIAGAVLAVAGPVLKKMGVSLQIDKTTATTIIIVVVIVVPVLAATYLASIGMLPATEYIELVKYIIVTVISVVAGYLLKVREAE
ncbi:MAG: hypothetical protein QXT14_08815 [Candidatus Bathyarchaeia archaeon]